MAPSSGVSALPRRRGIALLSVVLAGAACATTSPRASSAGGPASPPREGYVDAGAGVRLFYRLVGAGPDTVVVLHGGPGFSMSYLAPDLEPLSARHTLLFYDQRGTGRSTLVTDSASLDGRRFAEDLEAVRRWFRLDRLVLLAHSWGAAVAALYAGQHPARIGRLLIIDGIPVRQALRAAGFRRLDARRDSATRRRLAERRAAMLASPGSATACRAYFRLWFPATYADSAAMARSRGDFCAGTPDALANKIASVDRFTARSLGDWDWRPALRAVTAPALIMHGAADFVPVESAREWTSALPRGRLLLLEGSGHYPFVEVPDRFFPAADAFLRGRWPPRAESPPTPDW